MEIIGCPECAATAEVTGQGRVAGTDGGLDVVRVVCVARHWFLMTRDALVAGAGTTE